MPFIFEPKRQKEVFFISTPQAILIKLEWEISEFERSCLPEVQSELAGLRTAAFHAFNCAVTALHCADWAWNAAGADTKRRLADKFGFSLKSRDRSNLSAFIEALDKSNRDFYICRRIGNGSKHLGVDKKHPITADLEFAPESTALKKYLLDFVILDGETKHFAMDVFKRLCKYWRSLFIELEYIEGGQYVEGHPLF